VTVLVIVLLMSGIGTMRNLTCPDVELDARYMSIVAAAVRALDEYNEMFERAAQRPSADSMFESFEDI
jgi:hypothetical protein